MILSNYRASLLELPAFGAWAILALYINLFNQPTNLQLGTVQGDCEKLSGLFVWLTIMMQVIIHQIANQILTLI